MYFNNSVFNAEKMKRDDFIISNLTYLVENFKKVKKLQILFWSVHKS